MTKSCFLIAFKTGTIQYTFPASPGTSHIHNLSFFCILQTLHHILTVWNNGWDILLYEREILFPVIIVSLNINFFSKKNFLCTCLFLELLQHDVFSWSLCFENLLKSISNKKICLLSNWNVPKIEIFPCTDSPRLTTLTGQSYSRPAQTVLTTKFWDLASDFTWIPQILIN